MEYPVPPRARGWLFWPLLALSIVLMAAMDGRLRTDAAPRGIVSLELAGNERRAHRIYDSWEDADRQFARRSIRLDFLFLLSYSTAIGLATAWAADVLRARQASLAGSGAILAWLQWLAALLDAVENVALWRMLQGYLAQPYPRIAQCCAVPKFLIVLAGFAYVVRGLIIWLVVPVR